MTEIDDFFETHGWSKLDGSLSLSMYTNDYGVIGLGASPTVDDIADRWTEWQSVLFSQRKKVEKGDKKDLYLMIMLENEDPETMMRLQPISDDTNICRKIVLSQRGRTITETLKSEPFFQLAGVAEEELETSAEITESMVDAQVIADLAKKGASSDLRPLDRGHYRRTNAH